MRRAHSAAFLWIACLLAVAAYGQNDGVIHTLDGRAHAGTLIEIDEQGDLILVQGEDHQRLPFGEIHLIRLSEATEPPGGARNAGFLLARGDYLSGEVIEGDGDNLIVDHPLLGRLSLPIDQLRLFLPGCTNLPGAFRGYVLSEDEDVVYRKTEGALGEDFIRGTVDLFTKEGLTLECSLGLVDFTFDQLQAVLIAGSIDEPAPSSDVATMVLLKGGAGKVSGLFAGLKNGRILLRQSWCEELSLPLEAAASITFRQPSMVFLSDLDPVESKEIPYMGAASGFLYPYQRDRSVSGEEISCGRLRLVKGMGVHSRCLLTYDLDGAYSSFSAFIGLSNEVLRLKARGSIVYRVSVDGSVVFESPVLRGGDEAVELPPIPLVGAKRLILEADFADAFDTADRGFWGQAFLVRSDTGGGR